MDKHTMLIPIGTWHSGSTITMNIGKPLTAPLKLYAGLWTSLEDGVTIATAAPGEDFDIQMKVSLNVSLRNVEGFEREPISDITQQLIGTIERIIKMAEDKFF